MNARPDDPTRARLLSALLLALVFFAGSLAGAAALDSRPALRTTQRIETPSGERLSGLEMSPDQRAAVEAILARHQPAIDAIVQASLRDLRAVMDSVNSEVRVVLTPDQMAALDSLMGEPLQIRAVRRTLSPTGAVLRTDTLR